MTAAGQLSDTVERLLDDEDYDGARAVLEREPLSGAFDDHWLLTRIGLTFYEQRRYGEALSYAERASALAPRCPLVLWDLAGTHQMLNDHVSALLSESQSRWRWRRELPTQGWAGSHSSGPTGS